jgi:hypothetical protein
MRNPEMPSDDDFEREHLSYGSRAHLTSHSTGARRGTIEIEWSPHEAPAWEILSRHRSMEGSNGAWRRAVRMLGTDARLRRVNTLTGEVLTTHPGSKET